MIITIVIIGIKDRQHKNENKRRLRILTFFFFLIKSHHELRWLFLPSCLSGSVIKYTVLFNDIIGLFVLSVVVHPNHTPQAFTFNE